MRKTAQETPKKQVNSSKKPVQSIEKPVENDRFLYSISALSRKFKLDRATVRERLEKAEIKPHSEKAKEKLYHLDDVEIVLSQSELNEAKLKKIDAEAEIKLLELKRKSGEYASVSEFTDTVQRLMSEFYSRTVVGLPARVATKLHNANSSSEVAAILKAEMIKEWTNLRDNYPEYINDHRSGNRKGNR